MTTTPKVSRERADRAIAFFSEKLKDLLADDRRAAKEDDPNGMVHPIYMGKLIGPIYRDAIAILTEYADKLRAGVADGIPDDLTGPEAEAIAANHLGLLPDLSYLNTGIPALYPEVVRPGSITAEGYNPALSGQGLISREDEAAGWIVQTTLNDWVEFLKLPGMDQELEAYVWDEIDERVLARLRSRLYAPKVRVTRRDLDSLLIMLIDCGPLWYRGTMPEEGRVISILSGWLRSIGVEVSE